MSDAGNVLYILAVTAIIILVVLGAQKIINHLKAKAKKDKDKKDDDNSHWNIPPQIGIH